MRVARYARCASSASKASLKKKLEAIEESTLEIFVERAFAQNGNDKTSKSAYVKGLQLYHLRKKYTGDRVPDHIAKSLWYRPGLMGLWKHDPSVEDSIEIWTSEKWIFEPLYTGFRVIIVSVAGKVYAYSRFLSDSDFFPAEIRLPESFKKVLLAQRRDFVVDAIITPNSNDAVTASLLENNYSVSDKYRPIDVATSLGDDTAAVLEGCTRLVLLDLLFSDETDHREEGQAQRWNEMSDFFKDVPKDDFISPVVIPHRTTETKAKKQMYADCLGFTDGCAAKKDDAVYVAGRNLGWEKIKRIPLFGVSPSIDITARSGLAYVTGPLAKILLAKDIPFEGQGVLTVEGTKPVSARSEVDASAKHSDFCIVLDKDLFTEEVPSLKGKTEEALSGETGLPSLRSLL